MEDDTLIVYNVKKIFCFIFIIFFIEFGVFANDQRIISIDSDIYPLLEILIMEAGKPTLSSVYPYTEAEVNSILEDIEDEITSENGKKTIKQIRDLSSIDPLYLEDKFSVNITAAAATELYLNTSDDDSEWLYDYAKRLPIFSLKVETWFNEGFYALMEPELKKSRHLLDSNTNIFTSFSDINYHFPGRGFFSFGGDNWNLQIGRDRLEYGNGETGKLMLSSCPDFYDFIKLKGFVNNFSYTWAYINLESWKDSDPAERNLVDHALEVRLFDFVTLSVNESALIYGESAELQYLSPLIVYHNLIRNNRLDEILYAEDGTKIVSPTVINIFMSLGFNIVPVKGLSIYGEYLLDEIQTSVEQAVYGTGITKTPNTDAHMLGIKGSLPVGPGYINTFFEYVYVSPWCYLLSPKGGSMVWSHRDSNNVLKARTQILKPIGYKYGPDTLSFGGGVSYLVPGLFTASFSVDYILNGENTIESPYVESVEAAQMKTPSGIPEKRLILSLSGSYDIFSFLKTRIDLSYLDINNYKHVNMSRFIDFQTAFSIIVMVNNEIFK